MTLFDDSWRKESGCPALFGSANISKSVSKNTVFLTFWVTFFYAYFTKKGALIFFLFVPFVSIFVGSDLKLVCLVFRFEIRFSCSTSRWRDACIP